MPNFHVHVYKVESKAEVELDSANAEEAKSTALRLTKNEILPFASSDCSYIAIAFEQNKDAVTLQ